MKFDSPFLPGTAIRGMIVPTTVDPVVAESQQPYEGLPVEILVEQMEPEKLFLVPVASLCRRPGRGLLR